MLRFLIESMRPAQWTKNLILFAGVIFAQKFLDFELFFIAFVGFILFCLLSGAGYIINDVVDREKDALHPGKDKRPIASGKLSSSQAITASAILIIVSLSLGFWVNSLFGITALGYLVLNIGYSFLFKSIVIVDVMMLALGFVLRAIAGAVIVNVEISPWLLICTVLLALFLGLGKRRHELVILEKGAFSHRKILAEYSPTLLDEMISVVTSSTVMAYTLYTFFSKTALKTHYLMLTVPFVLYGIFRYLYLIHRKNEGGRPEVILLTDKPLLINILLWLIAVFLILYIT